jgi:hypothetical protein
MNVFLLKGRERATFLPIALLCALNERWRTCFLMRNDDEVFQDANTSLNFDPLTYRSETLKRETAQKSNEKRQAKHRNPIHLKHNFREVM